MEQNRVEEGSVDYGSALTFRYIKIVTVLNLLYQHIIFDNLYLVA
jgi:hypothetical protein